MPVNTTQCTGAWKNFLTASQSDDGADARRREQPKEPMATIHDASDISPQRWCERKVAEISVKVRRQVEESVRGLCPDDGSAEEAVALAVDRLLKKLPSLPKGFSSVTAVRSWLKRAAYYYALKLAKDPWYRLRGDGPDDRPAEERKKSWPDESAGLGHGVATPEQLAVVRDIYAALDELPPADRSYLEAWMAADRPEPISPAERVHLHRIRQRLWQLLVNKGLEPPAYLAPRRLHSV